MTPLQGVGKTPYPLLFRPPVMGLVLFLAGQLADALRIRSMAFSSSRQIPDRRVVADQFPVVALLEEFPLLRLYLGKLPADGLVLVVLRPHLPALGKDGTPMLGAISRPQQTEKRSKPDAVCAGGFITNETRRYLITIQKPASVSSKPKMLCSVQQLPVYTYRSFSRATSARW